MERARFRPASQTPQNGHDIAALRTPGMPASQAHWSDLVQESVIICDPDGAIVCWNAASERLYDWPFAAVLGRRLQDVLGYSPVALAISLGQGPDGAAGGEIVRTTAQGGSVVVQGRLSPRRSAQGLVQEWIETGLDLTAQRAAERQIDQSRHQYQNLFGAMPASLWEIDFSDARTLVAGWIEAEAIADLAVWFAQHPQAVRRLMRSTYAVNVNERATELFGPCQHQALLTDIERFWPIGSTADFAACVVSALQDKPVFTCETRMRRLDGSEFEALFTASYAPGTVATGRVIVNIVDYTEVKRGQAALLESEAFYRDMFHNSAVSAWHLDASATRKRHAELRAAGVTDLPDYARRHPDFMPEIMSLVRVVDVNATTLQLFGAKDREEMVGGSILPYWIPTALETLIGSFAASYNLEPSFRGLTRMRRLDGGEIDVLFTASASPALRASGQLLIAVVDMSDKVRAQNALSEMQASFAHAARVSSLGELTASIAHEVNQPLGAIASNGEACLLRLNQPDPDLTKIRGITREMISDARRASDIVVRIRSMASPQTGPHQSLSLNAVVEEAMTLLGAQIQKCGVATISALGPDLPWVMGDPIQLQQVVVNLALNALHALEGRSGGQITVRTTRQDHDHIILDLEDNGPGVAEGHLAHLFDSFFTTKPDGMGIGLSLCRSIVEAHHGQIEGANLAQGGARFSVRLPVASVEAPSPDLREA